MHRCAQDGGLIDLLSVRPQPTVIYYLLKSPYPPPRRRQDVPYERLGRQGAVLSGLPTSLYAPSQATGTPQGNADLASG